MNVLLSSLFTISLFLGSSGTQVLALQQTLNQDPDTRIASAGPGSLWNETNYFGSLTKSAVIRFQEKYASEVLTPAGLTIGNGYVGQYTRAKLNALNNTSVVSSATPVTPPAPTVATATQTATPSSVDYIVKDSEKIDIYTGDKMLDAVRAKIQDSIDSAIISHSTTPVEAPVIAPTEVPSVAIWTLSPRSGVPSTHVSVKGNGISTDSTIYFGSNYIVRTMYQDVSGNYSFVVPSIPPARYDVAIRTGAIISNTTTFVIRDLKNPFVHLQNISPTAIMYGDTLTITGSGFSPQGNVVVTTYQTFPNIPSPDGRTLVVPFIAERFRESAKVGKGQWNIPMSLYVMNDYGFSDSEKPFTLTL